MSNSGWLRIRSFAVLAGLWVVRLCSRISPGRRGPAGNSKLPDLTWGSSSDVLGLVTQVQIGHRRSMVDGSNARGSSRVTCSAASSAEIRESPQGLLSGSLCLQFESVVVSSPLLLVRSPP